MNARFILISLSALLLSCGELANLKIVTPGPTSVGALQIDVPTTLNRAPIQWTPSMHAGSTSWTHDGLLLDRLSIIPGLHDGAPLLYSENNSAALPVFKADMLPNELEELTESSIVKLFAEGTASASTTNLRPNRFGDDRGVLFDLEVAFSDGPDYRGTVGAFIHAERLYMIIYLAAEPYYYDKYHAEAEAIILSARI